MSKLDVNKRIELALFNFEKINSGLIFADKKIGITLVFQTGLTGFLITNQTNNIKAVTSQNFDLIHFLLYFSLVLFIILITRGIYFSLKALYPDISQKGNSLFFFGSIASQGIGKFKKNFSVLTAEKAEEDLINQVFIISQIANIKFSYVKNSIFSTFLAVIFWTTSLLLIAYLK